MRLRRYVKRYVEKIGALFNTLRVNLLKDLGAEIGYLGERIFAKAFPDAARGEAVAMLLEGMYSARALRPRSARLPQERLGGVVSRHVTSRWPIHKSWYVPVVDDGEYAVLVDPPRGVVRYVGRDVDGSYEYLLYLGLAELEAYVRKGAEPTLLRGWEMFNNAEVEAARAIFKNLENAELAALVIDTLREVDFLLLEGEAIYHVEVKTTIRPVEAKLRKKWMFLQKRQQVLEKIGMRPALAVVVPRENWEVEILIEKS
ncbi:MAG: hypothetical protein QXP31_01370 [Pyrobaculum sp.]